MRYLIVGIGLVLFFIIYDRLLRNSSETDAQKNRAPRRYQPLRQIEASGTKVPINDQDYTRFILVKNSSSTYVLDMIKEHGELSGNEEFSLFNFGLAVQGDWIIVGVDSELSFYEYHNLVGWLGGFENHPDIPEHVIGFAKHKADKQEDYLFLEHPENEFGDSLIGAFRNGVMFSISLPDAYEEFGNIIVNNDHRISFTDNQQAILDQGLALEDLESFKYVDYKIKMKL